MSNSLIDGWAREDWPPYIEKPKLPQGYEWVCLRQTQAQGDSPRFWWIRVCWTIKGGKKRILKLPGEHFLTPQAAIDYAMGEVFHHQAKRAP